MKKIAFFAMVFINLITALGQGKKNNTNKISTVPIKVTEPPKATEPPEQQLTPIKAEPGKEVVAIYYITTARDYSYDYAIGVGNAIEAGFVRSTRFTVVERSRFGMLKEEEKFKEANTSEIVSKATKLGAKIIVTGHIVGVSYGDLISSYDHHITGKYATISLQFKIIDVVSGEIKLSELISGRGDASTQAEATLSAYASIDQTARNYIAAFLPQKFKYMSTVLKSIHKKQEYLDQFKIWGGSDNGIKVGDNIELYSVSYITNPNTNKQVEEKKLLGYAKITEVNSGSTATCTMINAAEASRYSPEILDMATNHPENLSIEFKGTGYVRTRGLFGL